MKISISDSTDSGFVQETIASIKVVIPGTQGAPGASDHGILTGLADDDHTQYHNDTRGDARYYTQAQITSFLSGKEPTITAGTTSQYYRGDKTFQTLNKAAVGLSNVDNTSDLSKPISTATQAALSLKANASELASYVPYGGATSDIDLGSTYKITNMVNPSNDFDAATKNYVDFSIFSIPPDPTKWSIDGNAASGSPLTLGSTDDSNLIFIQNGISFLSIRYSDALFSLNNAIGDPRFDILANVIYDDASTVAVTFNERKLVSQSGVDLLEFSNDVVIRDTTGDTSFESTQRILLYSVASGGNIAYKWEDEIFFAPAGDTRMDLSVQEIYFNDQLRIKWLNDGAQIGPNLAVGTGINVGDATIHQNAGTATATYHKFTAGTTTGISVSDGFDVGITSTGIAQVKQRENLNLEFYQNNSIRMQFLNTGACDASGTTQFRGGVGSAAAPTWSFAADATKGMYHSAANQLSWSVSSAERMRIDSAGKLFSQQGATGLRGVVTTYYTQTNSVGNVGAGEDTLHSTAVAGSTFSANGDSLDIIMSGTFAANANNKRIRLKWGAITLFDTTALVFNAGDWEIRARIFRITTTTGKAIVTFSSSNALLATATDYQAFSANYLISNTLQITGEATADNDIVQELTQAFWVPTF